jgi:predicted oxidoreductase
VSRLGYGCDHIGGSWDATPVGDSDVDHAQRLIHTAFDSGINLFDLADIYAFGKAEVAFGKVLRAMPGMREKLVIQSKCGIRYPDEPEPGAPPRIDCSGEHIIASVEKSLARLGTDYLDILLLHIPDMLIEPEDVAQAFDDLERSGKVRYFGVSNHTSVQIALLKKYLRQPIVVNQVQLSLDHSYPFAAGNEYTLEIMDHLLLQLEMFRGTLKYDPHHRYHHSYAAVAEAGTLDYCRLNDIRVQAWSPLRGALLRPPIIAKPEVREMARVLTSLAEKKGTTLHAVALAWILRHPAGVIPIIGPTKPEHVIANCAADSVDLSREEWYILFRASSATEAQSRELN